MRCSRCGGGGGLAAKRTVALSAPLAMRLSRNMIRASHISETHPRRARRAWPCSPASGGVWRYEGIGSSRVVEDESKYKKLTSVAPRPAPLVLYDIWRRRSCRGGGMSTSPTFAFPEWIAPNVMPGFQSVTQFRRLCKRFTLIGTCSRNKRYSKTEVLRAMHARHDCRS